MRLSLEAIWAPMLETKRTSRETRRVLPQPRAERAGTQVSSSAVAGTSIAIADKNPMIRAGLADFIRTNTALPIIGNVGAGHELINLCARQPVTIAIVGWSLPDMTGGDVLSTLRRRQAATRVIIYTGETSPKVLRQAVRDGAWGFISKGDEPAALLDTISVVARGRLCLPFVDLHTLNDDPLASLTVRERELLAALANGWTNLQIAARIGISSNTVKYHLKNLYDKLGVNNRAMAVALFVAGP